MDTEPGIGKPVWEGEHRTLFKGGVLSVLSVVAFFGMSYIVLIPGLVKDVLHRGSSAYGVLLAMTGLGAIAGSFLVSYLIRFVDEPTLMKLSFLSLGIILVGFALLRPFFLSCIASFGSAVSFIVAGAASSAMFLNLAVREMRGRVSSLYIIVYVGISAVGDVFLAYLSDVRSIPFSLALGGAVCIVLAAMVVAFPRLAGGQRAGETARPAVTV
jgi:MFS family permease